MYNTSAVFNVSDANSRVNAYLVNEILDATPEKLLIKIYDFAIAHCKNKNLEKTNKALIRTLPSHPRAGKPAGRQDIRAKIQDLLGGTCLGS